jgi:hypothetical protein
MIDRTSLWCLLAVSLLLAVASFSRAYAEDNTRPHARTWKTVDELSAEELRKIDLSTDTPRHPQVPYLPAEPYPFTAPYTAEEMGYRVMEFPQRPRWSCAYANVWGSLSPQGVLLSPGKSVTFIDYPEPVGVGAEFLRKPGEELYRQLNQNTFPPDAEGSQRMAIRYRTDREFVKKEEAFQYSPSIRRVRHQVPSRRQDKFPNQAQTLDDATGRDAWEFSWRFLGTAVLYQTVRFPVTRPTVILGNGADGNLHEIRTADIKPMGSAYPYYTADGGVECYVVEARAREDWLPDYYAPRILYWLEKHSFYPLRVEQYGRDGKLALIEVRLTDMFNPALSERGYGPLFVLYWDIASDIMSYMVRDNHRVKRWRPEEQQVFFSPDFMRRQWYLDTSVKSQAEVVQPDQFFLRPALEEDKFPSLRLIQLPVEIAARVQAQEAAGHLVFELEKTVPPATVVAKPTPTPVAAQVKNVPVTDEAAADTYTLRHEQVAPTAVR